ncbi:hypothetical protein EON63_18565 [archaeon]|nr:MAG: hypothetical protein EON63_18565 [archaeon]
MVSPHPNPSFLPSIYRFSTSPIRSKFTRLKEVMQVLTSPSLKDVMGEHTCTLLTVTDMEAVFSMRVD